MLLVGSLLQNPLSLPFGEHVALDYVSNYARDKRVASWLGGQPPLPFELIQSGEQRVA